MSGLAKDQLDFLLAGITPGRVQHAQGQAHLAAWDVRRTLLRAFGWGGWSYDLSDVTLVHEREAQGGRWTVVYRVTLTLVIKDRDGYEVASFTEAATGDAQNQKSPGDAHDMALKTAESQALKRAAMNLGDQFGLSLYAKGRTDAVVIRSLGHVAPEDAPALPAAEKVDAGEDDAHGQPAPAEQPAAQPAPQPRVMAADVADQWSEQINAAADLAALRKVWEDAGRGGQLDVLVPMPGDDAAPVPLRDVITFRRGELEQGAAA